MKKVFKIIAVVIAIVSAVIGVLVIRDKCYSKGYADAKKLFDNEVLDWDVDDVDDENDE